MRTRVLERWHRLWFDAPGVLAVELDRTGLVVEVSGAWAQACRRRPSELVGQPVLQSVFPEDRPAVERALGDTGGVSAVVARLGTADGGWTRMRLSVSPAPGEGTLCVATEHEADRQEHRMLAEVARRTSNMVVVCTPDGKTEWVNEAFVRHTGYSLEDMRGKLPGRVLQGPGSDSEEARRVGDRIRAGEPVRAELLNYTRDGRPYWIDFAVEPVRDERGAVTHYMAIEHDVTSRKALEAQNDAAMRRLRALADQAPGVLFQLELEPGGGQSVAFVSSRVEALLGLSVEAVMAGEGLFSRAWPEDRERLEAGLAEATAQATGLKADFRVEDAEGTRWLEVRGAPERRPDGVTVWNGVISDVTEDRRAKRELEGAQRAAAEASQAKSRFLANVSHEIRTPLNGILGLTQLVLDSPLEQQQKDLLQSVHRSGQVLLELINSVLDLSKVEAGHLELERVEFSLEDVVADVARTVAPRAHEKGLELVVDVDGAAGLYLGDPARTRQVLLNLVGNAVKFTAHGVVELVARGATAEGLVMTVKDTGIGIPGHMISRVFDAFTQVDGSISRRYGGTGLGLSITRQLVTAMGGSVWVESEVGQGSTFTVTLPLMALPRPQPASRVPVRRVLVVDDAVHSRMALTRQLERHGVEVVACEDASGAMAVLRRGQLAPLDAAIIAARLPDFDGPTLAEALRRDPALTGLKVVLLTSTVSLVPAAARARAGEARVMVRPVMVHQLAEAMASFPSAGPRGQLRPLAGRGLEVLVAEDNPINAKVVRTLLERQGHVVTVVTTGVEAVAAWQRGGFDLVLMDVHMPDLDGLEATRRIRGLGAAGAAVPIIALTASAMAEDVQRCRDAGMDDFLAKPLDLHALTRRIERLAEERRFAAA